MHRSGIYIEYAFRGKASEYRDSIFIHEEASMLREESRLISGRRSFLKAALPGGALFCLGGGCLLRQARAQDRPKTAAQKHKFLEDSGMSLTEVFIIAYVPQLGLLRGLEKEIGSEKFVAMLKRIIDEGNERRSAEFAKKLGKNDLAAYTQNFRQADGFYQKALTFQVVEDTPRAFEVKVTECLWAKTYRDVQAADLGYVLSCYGDFTAAQGFNHKMRLVRTKTLMQGEDCCNHRYVLEG
jgi:hypothetical protein